GTSSCKRSGGGARHTATAPSTCSSAGCGRRSTARRRATPSSRRASASATSSSQNRSSHISDTRSFPLRATKAEGCPRQRNSEGGGYLEPQGSCVAARRCCCGVRCGRQRRRLRRSAVRERLDCEYQGGGLLARVALLRRPPPRRRCAG